jgi:hypothetical protein
MPRYIIERAMPGVGNLSAEQLMGAANKSNGVLRELGPDVQWVRSFVTPDKIYCEYIATSEELVRKHAQIAGFPADTISRVVQVMDPTTAEKA